MGHHLSHKGERKKRHISNAYKNVLLLAVHLPLMHKQKQAVQQRTGLHIKPSGVRTENSQSEWFDNHRGSKVNRATLQLGLGELQTQQTAPSIWRWYVGLIAFIFTLLTDLFTLKPGSPHTLDTILILPSIVDTFWCYSDSSINCRLFLMLFWYFHQSQTHWNLLPTFTNLNLYNLFP